MRIHTYLPNAVNTPGQTLPVFLTTTYSRRLYLTYLPILPTWVPPGPARTQAVPGSFPQLSKVCLLTCPDQATTSHLRARLSSSLSKLQEENINNQNSRPGFFPIHPQSKHSPPTPSLNIQYIPAPSSECPCSYPPVCHRPVLHIASTFTLS